jgi:hypothetical protein
MYRIELSPGEQAVFRTIEELATGIRNGVISPRARIYHGASEKWLPIEFHPHYKQALESLTSGKPVQEPAAPPAAPAPPPAAAVPAVPPPGAKPRPVKPRPPRDETVHDIELPSFALTETKVPQPAPSAPPAPPASRSRSVGQRPIRLAVVGAAAIFSTHVVLSAAPPRIELPPESVAAKVTAASLVSPPSPVLSAALPNARPAVRAVAVAVRAPAPPKSRAAPHDSVGAIDPPPAELDLSLPTLPRADSIVPASSARDSAAMKRILRAVGGRQ